MDSTPSNDQAFESDLTLMLLPISATPHVNNVDMAALEGEPVIVNLTEFFGRTDADLIQGPGEIAHLMVLIGDDGTRIRVVARRLQLHIPVFYHARLNQNHQQLARLMRENVDIVALDDTALVRLAVLYIAERAQGEDSVERLSADMESDDGNT